MPLEIRQLPRMRLAYMRQTGPYGPSLTQLWERFGRWCEANRLSEPRPKYYGMMAPGLIPAGWEAAPRPAIEVYDEDFAVNPATGAFPCWLCLAVQRTH